MIIIDTDIYIYRERELGYDAMDNMDRPRAMDQFFIIKDQIVDLNHTK
jgi:hypothetical protein